jgi:hypothetical protein
MSKTFASQADLADKKITFEQLSRIAGPTPPRATRIPA